MSNLVAPSRNSFFTWIGLSMCNLPILVKPNVEQEIRYNMHWDFYVYCYYFKTTLQDYGHHSEVAFLLYVILYFDVRVILNLDQIFHGRHGGTLALALASDGNLVMLGLKLGGYYSHLGNQFVTFCEQSPKA
jgi:hypothetical protein